MFCSDNPIQCKENDRLNRTEFSKQLARAILSYTKIDNFTIGLCGKWGSGKTSILNMMVEEINERSTSLPEEEQPVVVYFNPWNYSDCPQLISRFFQTIQDQIKVDTTNEKLNAIGNALQKYSSVFEYTSYIPVVGSYLAPLKSLFEGVGEHLSEKTEEVSLNEQKRKVINALKDQNHKFIIIIDDIDRLNNEQIRLIFQLVNSLAGFPNIIYVLSFDRTIVSRALSAEQNCNGEEYLEKIIQVPFEVPMANKSLIDDMFCEMYANIIFEHSSIETFESTYWSNVFNNCISPFIENIRDVNRVINSFEFKYGIMSEEINCIDLLALTTLQVCAPEIYNWILNNSSSLTGSSASAGAISHTEQKENYKNYLERFNQIYQINPRLMMKVLQVLFPKFCWTTGGYGINHESDNELRRKQKLASSDKIGRYFNLSLEEIIIDKKQIEKTIYDYDSEQLKDYFDGLMQSENLYKYLREFIAFVPDIPQDRKLMFIIELTKLRMIDENTKRAGFLKPTVNNIAYSCVIEIFKRNDKNENRKYIVDMIEKATIHTLPYICEIMEDIERGYARIGNSINSEYKFIEEHEIDDIDKQLLAKIKEISEQANLLDYNDNKIILFMWSILDKESHDDYIKLLISNIEDVPKYLNRLSLYWHGSNNKDGWDFKEESFDEIISAEEAYKRILEIKNTKEFSKLDHKYKQSAVAFYLWYNSEEHLHCDVTREQVDADIPLWEYVEDQKSDPQ